MKDLSLKKWLDKLGDKTPAPGGGAVAAVNAALSSATLKMVCEYSTGAKFEHVEKDMKDHIQSLDELLTDSLKQAENDEKAYLRLREAYKKADGADIQDALAGAVQPSVRVIRISEKILKITDNILGKANVNLVSDIAVSVANTKAALESAVVNIEINAISIKNDRLNSDLALMIEQSKTSIKKADKILEAVHKKIKKAG